MKLNARYTVLAVALLGVAAIPQAFAQTVQVGSCLTGPTSYPTIQQAVNASTPGGTVDVCPGTYPEQVTINEPLTLTGVSDGTGDAAVIVTPSGGVQANTTDVDSLLPVAAQVLVQFASGVTIQKLTVDGASNGLSGCGTDIVGILFQDASGTVSKVAVRNQTLIPADYGCQDGEGILVETSTGTSVVAVKSSSVHNYQKNGITGNDLGTTLTVTSNNVQGWGPTPSIAQNGIQIGFGAAGTVTGNVVIDDVYTGPSYGSSGILLFDALENGNISVSSNTVGNTQYAVALATDHPFLADYDDGVTVSSNQIFGTANFDAIDACTNGNTITANTIMNSSESAIHLDNSCSSATESTGNNNLVTNNIVNESVCAGILVDPGTNTNTTAPDTYYNVPFAVTNSTAGCPALVLAPSIGSPVTRSGHHVFSPKGSAKRKSK